MTTAGEGAAFALAAQPGRLQNDAPGESKTNAIAAVLGTDLSSKISSPSSTQSDGTARSRRLRRPRAQRPPAHRSADAPTHSRRKSGESAELTGDIKRLRGSSEYRLRIGDWRVRFIRDGRQLMITVVRVLPRGRAYDR
jgi:hypothetical protein